MTRRNIESHVNDNIDKGMKFMESKFKTSREAEAYKAGADLALGLVLDKLHIDLGKDYISTLPECAVYVKHCTTN